MGYGIPPRPRFLESALQGLAFWIGHRHSLFHAYPLPEGAVVSEACNLIQANIPDSLQLRPECQFKQIIPPSEKLEGVGRLARVDLAIFSKHDKVGKLPDYKRIQFAVEVKRGMASRAAIDEDLKRLYRFLMATPTQARAFLIVVSEAKSPNRFVLDGKSRLATNPIPGVNGCFRVRRTVKATASFSNKKRAHYVCLLEVFCARPTPLPKI